MRAKHEPHPEPILIDEDEILTPEQLAAQWAAEAPEAAGPVANLVSSLVMLGLGIAGVLLSLQLGLGTPAEPKPGMWPFIVSLVVAVLSGVQAVIGRTGGADGEKFSNNSWYAAVGFVTLVGMVLLMPVIGFEIPSILLCFIWMRWLGGERWRSAAIYSVVIVAAFYGIFIAALGTTIPRLF